jgi:integrase
MNNIVSINQLAKIFSLDVAAAGVLARDAGITMSGGFCARGILADCIKRGPPAMTADDLAAEEIRRELEELYPEAMAAYMEYAKRLRAGGRRGGSFNLVKVSNKKHGFLYYVRYKGTDGKLLPSKWSTGTASRAEAEAFAAGNREAILEAYFARKNRRPPVPAPETPPGDALPQAAAPLYPALENAYKPGSAYLAAAGNRGRALSQKTRSVYDHFINKRFIPFLKNRGITDFAGVVPPVIFTFQDCLLAEGNKAQTINRYLGAVKAVFNYLSMTGRIRENAFDRVKMLHTGGRNSAAPRGCLEIDQARGVFTTRWANPLHYLLCLMIYSTGLRNSELERVRRKDIIVEDGCYFVSVTKSKSENGIRRVPLHPFVYRRLMEYAGDMLPESYLFSACGNRNQSTLYKEANAALGRRIGMSERQMGKRRITFYSGRHFWKTLMSAEGLGDVEEYFMGHKVSSDVAKLYNHKDKQGKNMLARKAREVFRILDKRLFVDKRNRDEK